MDETLRLEKLAAFNERQAEEDIEIAGFVIPKGTQVLNALCLSLDDTNSFPNPTSFDLKNVENVKNAGLAFSPFGFGVRKCPGYRFSNLEVALVAMELLTRFRVSVNKSQEKIKSAHGFVTKPAREIFVKIEEHN